MAKTITCPACGNRGDASDDVHFEVRGQFQGRPVRKCLRCGLGLYVRAFGRPDVIPDSLWRQMEDMWESEFGSADDGDESGSDGDDAVHMAADTVAEGFPAGLSAGIALVFPACVIGVRDLFPTLAREYDDWDDIEGAELESMLRIAIAPSLLLFLRDEQNHAHISQVLDSQPSRTVDAVWEIYADRILTPAEARIASELLDAWKEGDSAVFGIKVAQALRSTAGLPSEMPFDEGRVDCALHACAEHRG